MSVRNEGPWRCRDNQWKFCPVDGCLKSYGCARKQGWKLGQDTPSAYKPITRLTQPMEIESVK